MDKKQEIYLLWPKKPAPGNKYEYVQSIATHHHGEGCACIKAKYSILQIPKDIFLIRKTAEVGPLRGCKAQWEGPE